MNHIISVLKQYWADKKFIKKNLITWLIVYSLFLLIEFSADGFAYSRAYLDLSIALVAIILIFYIQFFICEIFFEKNKAKFYLAFTIFFLCFLVFSFWLSYTDYKRYLDKKPDFTGFMVWHIFLMAVYFFVIIFISTTIWSLRNTTNNAKQNKELQQSNTLLKSQLFQSELSFLRAQINPHFLQNCLNFIYSDTRKTNPNAADAVMLLSTIMRYSVADNAATGGMALLKDEIRQVESIIQIHQLRFEQKLNISFSKEGQFEHKQIVPMILLTLVENLIKYGDLNNSQYPAKIDCSVDEKEKKIYFTTSNKKAYTKEIISTGLGLKNIRERLSLIWNDNFSLQKEETDDYYTVKLCMPYIAIQDNIKSAPKLNLSTLNS
jgi:two-component system, LytTR family, sensor kinase